MHYEWMNDDNNFYLNKHPWDSLNTSKRGTHKDLSIKKSKPVERLGK